MKEVKVTSIFWHLQLITKAFIGFFISTFLLCLLFPWLIPFWIYTRIMLLKIKLKFGKSFQKASGIDVSQGIDSDLSRPYLISVAKAQGIVDLENVILKFKKEVTDYKDKKGKNPYKRFAQVYEKHCGYYIFRDDENFNVKNHFKKVYLKDIFPEYFDEEKLSSVDGDSKYVLGGPHTKNLPDISWERILNRYLSRYGSEPFPPGTPSWSITFIEGKDNQIAVVFKAHHALCDGIYLLRFYLEKFADPPTTYVNPYNYFQPNLCKKILEGLYAYCMLPFGIKTCFFSYEKSPLHGPKLTGKKMYMISKPILLERLKKIKQKTGATMNSILLLCVSNSIASVFRKTNCAVRYVLMLIPVSLHNFSKPVKLRNDIGLKGVALWTFIEKYCNGKQIRSPNSHVQRLFKTQEWINRSMYNPSFIALHYLLVVVCSVLPSALIEKLNPLKGITLGFSNIIGPKNEMKVYGLTKTDGGFFIPDKNPIGMSVSVGSYNGIFRVGLMVDRALIPTEEEGEEFLEAFEEEIEHLEKEIENPEFTKKNNEDMNKLIKEYP